MPRGNETGYDTGICLRGLWMVPAGIDPPLRMCGGGVVCRAGSKDATRPSTTTSTAARCRTVRRSTSRRGRTRFRASRRSREATTRSSSLTTRRSRSSWADGKPRPRRRSSAGRQPQKILMGSSSCAATKNGVSQSSRKTTAFTYTPVLS